MRKLFLKHQLTVLSLALLVSFSAQAGYSTDAACSAVSNAAKNGATADKKKIDDVNTSINRAIESTKSCIETVTDALNQAIPSFGGSIFVTLINQGKRTLAGRACNYLSDVTNSANNAVSNAAAPISTYVGVQPPVINSTGTVTMPNVETTLPLTTRLANIF
jgi:phage-related protein